MSYRYRHEVEQPFLDAAVGALGSQDLFPFSAPSFLVDPLTHQDIQSNPNGVAADRLRSILADATRELCRRTLEEEVPNFNFNEDLNNCDAYTPEAMNLSFSTVEASEYDDSPGSPVELNPACFATCLLDECSPVATSGAYEPGYDPAPESPFSRTVRCRCQIEEIGECPSPTTNAMFPAQTTIEESFCVPDDRDDPANYCRTDIASYLAASIRAVNHYSGVDLDAQNGDCDPFESPDLNIHIECLPVDAHGDIQDEASGAYGEQNDSCAFGCSNLACDEIDADSGLCGIEGNHSCEPPCTLSDACDCDLLPQSCFESEPVNGVCLPDPMGGVDGGTDGGGSIERLRSATTLLTGTWLIASQDFECSEVEPGGSLIPPTGNPRPTSTVDGYSVTNGTSFTAGLQHTCPNPGSEEVSMSTFGTTLGELCERIPLCKLSEGISLALSAREGAETIASASLVNDGGEITAVESGVPLTLGDHTVQMCVEHTESDVEACSDQAMRASAPLGSGIDGFGYFAGEMGSDFVRLADKPGVTALQLSDDGSVPAALPSDFSFPFYGTSVSGSLWVGANGGIRTSAGLISATNTSMPNPSLGPDIAVYWDDLDPSAGGGVYTWFDGTRFIVSWEDVPHGRDGGDPTIDGISAQVHIYRSGYIELHYLDVEVGDPYYDVGMSATVGLGDPLGAHALEISRDESELWASGLTAVGVAHSSEGCLAEELLIPPQVACSAASQYLSVCTPSGDSVDLLVPDVGECSPAAVDVAGFVVESGRTVDELVPLSSPSTISTGGTVQLDEGVHRIEWWPVDDAGDPVGPSFPQLVIVNPWVHSACGGVGRSTILLTEGDDTLDVTAEPSPVAFIGQGGADVLVATAGDDFIGDGADAGICEAGEGQDQMVGEEGDDSLDGGSGADQIWGGTGDDLLIGADGADVLDGQEGNDVVQGGLADDELWGGLGDDVLEGDDGADTLIPGSGINAVYGGPGDDVVMILDPCELTSGAFLSGGSGLDVLRLPPGMVFADVTAAGVIVDEDIEIIENSTELPNHRAACSAS